MFNTFLNTQEIDGKNYLCIWIANPTISYDIVKSDINVYFEDAVVPENCFIIIPNTIDLENSDLNKVKNRDLVKVEDRLTYFNKTQIQFITYNQNGHFENYYNQSDAKEINTLLNRIIDSTIIQLFNKNDVMMTFDSNYHFRTLSGKHTDKFIKISNLLVDKNGIDFLSICMLKHLNEKNIYVDTSTIISLIQASIILKKELDPTYEVPNIQNFHSYEKIEDYMQSINASESLVIISTTTTATLIKDIKKINSKVQNILVLFYYPVKDTEHDFSTLIKLKKEMGISTPPENYTSENCKFCQNGSIPVQLHSEQFILSIKEPTAVKLTIYHQPQYLNNFFQKYSAENILTFGGRKNAERFDFTIDSTLLVNNIDFVEKLTYILKRHFTFSIKQIIYIDENSKHFAEKINEIIKQLGGNKIPINIKEDFFELTSHDKDDSILIVAGSISSGYVLEEISRQLRDTHPHSSRFYMIGISKQFSKQTFDFMKGNIDKNHMFSQPHLVLEVDKILLPTKTIYSTWDKELLFLKNTFSEEFGSVENKLIEERINWLEETKKNATSSNIFWKDSKNNNLKLADGFAFWGFYNSTHTKHQKTSEADVLYTFALVLQYARVVKKDLEQMLYDPKIIAPENFARFNDGILQSSLLRLSTNHELDYSTTHEFSKTITHMIKNIVIKYNTKQGEAAMEFLIALCTKHLKLHAHDFSELIECFKGLTLSNYPEHYKLLIEYLISTLNDNKA